MHWLVLTLQFIAYIVGFRLTLYGVKHLKTPKIAPKPALKANYWKIARLELELLGETKLNSDSPIPAGCKNEAEIHGIDPTGHLKNGSCNLNASLGPACTKIAHYRKRERAAEEARYQIAVKTSMALYGNRPYEDIYSPNWIDGEGRPW